MPIARRYDFVLLFDVKDGNPNGDPDAGNLPRIDAETGHGLVTDVSLKRKVRNFVAITKEQDQRDPVEGEQRFEIYVREKAILNLQHQRAYSALKLDPPEVEEAEPATLEQPRKKSAKAARKGSGEEVEKARAWMCQNFFDVRTFGAVMGLGVNAGHDLSQHNLATFLEGVPGVLEVSIGHALISEALVDGLAATVQRYRTITGG